MQGESDNRCFILSKQILLTKLFNDESTREINLNYLIVEPSLVLSKKSKNYEIF
jgi:hypothetical protein